MAQSIQSEGGVEKHIDKFGDIFTGAHFVAAVERGVNEANLRKLMGQPGHPKALETIQKWKQNL